MAVTVIYNQHVEHVPMFLDKLVQKAGVRNDLHIESRHQCLHLLYDH